MKESKKVTITTSEVNDYAQACRAHISAAGTYYRQRKTAALFRELDAFDEAVGWWREAITAFDRSEW